MDEDKKIIVEYVNAATNLSESIALDIINNNRRVSRETEDLLNEFVDQMQAMMLLLDETDNSQLN